LASENSQAEVVKFISEYEANANTRNKLPSTRLDTVEYGADDDGKDDATVSLHAAAEEGNIDTLKSLLERGVDINIRNASNQTPLARAAAKGNVDVVHLLIESSSGAQRWIHVISRGGPHCTGHHDMDISKSRGFFSITAQT
jgi:ankyrin repeat protein